MAPRHAAVQNIFAGTVAKYVLLALTIGIGVFMMPFTVHHLGKADYGLWMLVASMTYYFQLLDLGYGNGLVRHVTEADARGDTNGVNEVLSTFVVVYSGIGLLALAGACVLALFVVPHFPHLSAADIRAGQVVMVVLGIRIAVGFPMTVFGAVTTARQQFALNTAVSIVASIVSAAVTYVVLEWGYGLTTLVPATTAVNLLAYVGYARVARHVFPEMRIAPSLFSRVRLREVTAFSLYLFVIDISAQLGFNMDNVVIGAFIGTGAVAVYTVAQRLSDYQRQLCNQFNGMLFPVVVDFDARGDRRALKSTLVEGTRLAVALVVGVTICLVVFARPLIHRWMGPGFDEATPALYALALAGILLVAQGPVGNILLAIGRHRLVAGVSIAEALVNLALTVVLVPYYGITGAAVATLIPVVVAHVAITIPVACRAMQVPFATFARDVTAPAAIAAAPSVLVALVLRWSWMPASLGSIVLAGAVVGLVYVVALVALGLKRQDRARYLAYFRRADVVAA